MLVVGEQLHTHKMQKWLKPSIMNSARAFSLLRISGNREKGDKEPSIFSLLIVFSSVLTLHSIVIHAHNIPDVCTLKCLFHSMLVWNRLALPFRCCSDLITPSGLKGAWWVPSLCWATGLKACMGNLI